MAYAEQRQSDTDKLICERVRSIFDESFAVALPKLKKLEKMQAAYECQLPDDWGTFSQIFLPYFRTAVEQALPNFMNYLFPKSGLVTIQPTVPMSFEQVLAVQNYYDDLVQNKINLKQQGLLTLKDCAKLNIGYGQVTTEIVTPVETITNQIFAGEEMREVRKMDLGAPKEVIQYKYIDWRSVIPTPDGGTPEETSCVFHLDGIREDVFEEMFRLDELNEVRSLKGDPKAIITETRKGKTSLAHFPIWWVMGEFGNTDNTIRNIRKLNDIQKRMRLAESSPVIVPVLKCYFKREHIWITADGTVIYHIKDKLQTLRCPIVVAKANPDGNNWYTMGDVGSSFDATEGANILQNALMDMMSYKLHPATVVNRLTIRDESQKVEPYAQFDAYGAAGDAVAVIQGPQIDQSMFALSGGLEQQIALANGQPMNLQGGGTAGVMRGGGGAFESFLQTTQARAKQACSVLQYTWLEPIVNNVILMSQIIGQDDKYIYKDELTSSYVEKTITAKDLQHGFMATVSLDEKFHSTPADRSMDMALYMQVYKDNPKIDQVAALADVTGDREKFNRLKASPEVEQQQLAELQARMQAEQRAKAAAAGQGMDKGAQAMMGGAAQAGGGL